MSIAAPPSTERASQSPDFTIHSAQDRSTANRQVRRVGVFAARALALASVLAATLLPGPRAEAKDAPALTAPAGDDPQTQVRRFAVIIGANDGGTDRVRLRYAIDDAEAFAAVMQVYGGVAPERLFRVDEPDPAAIAQAFAAVHAALDPQAPGRAELVVFYSGHADAQGLLLGGARLPYAELRRHIDAVPATVRIGIVDACDSGAFVRAKGGQRRPPFLVDQATQVSGHAYLASSSVDEAAQESDRLGASYFSHALVTGLRGAADTSGDGVVTLNEAYQFAFRETLARTEGSHLGAQHPSYDMQLAGSGDVVLTDLRATSASLLVGRDVGGRLYVRDADGRLLAELDKPRGQPVRLGLAPGDYRVRLEDLDGVGHGARLSLVEGAATHLAVADLRPVGPEATRARGGLADPFPGPTADPSASGVQSSTEAPALKFGISVVPGLSTDDEDHVRVFSFSPLVGRTGGVSALEIGGLFNLVRRDVDGIQIGGLGSHVGGAVAGAQIGGLLNANRGISGVGVAGLVQLIDGPQDGVAAGGITNLVSGEFSGVNLSGIASLVGGGGYGFQGAGVVSRVGGDHTGVQVAGVADLVGEDLRGIQATGLVGSVGDHLEGLQLAGLHARADSVEGVQVGGLSTWSSGAVDGGQIALVNIGGDLRGAQIGLVNIADEVSGTQIGLVNVADHVDGASIGLLPWVADGRHQIEVFATELALTNLGYRLGNEYLHGLLSVGAANASGDNRMVVSGGFGGHIPITSHLSVDIDLLSNLIVLTDDWGATPAWAVTARVLAQWRFAPHLAVFAGPSWTGALNDQPIALGFDAYQQSRDSSGTTQQWPGLVAGVAF